MGPLLQELRCAARGMWERPDGRDGGGGGWRGLGVRRGVAVAGVGPLLQGGALRCAGDVGAARWPRRERRGMARPWGTPRRGGRGRGPAPTGGCVARRGGCGSGPMVATGASGDGAALGYTVAWRSRAWARSYRGVRRAARGTWERPDGRDAGVGGWRGLGVHRCVAVAGVGPLLHGGRCAVRGMWERPDGRDGASGDGAALGYGVAWRSRAWARSYRGAVWWARRGAAVCAGSGTCDR
jgi:hypothetical protein